MKKNILLMVLAVISALPLASRELTPEQKAFRSSIMSFIREEGFSPSIDEDNSLTFKKEGELYWIDIAESSPFYIEFHRSGLKCSDANKNIVLQSCNEANKKVKCVKAIMGETSVSLVIELFCHSAEEFKYTFYKSLKELESAYSTVKGYYNKMDDDSTPSLPFTYTSCEVANVDTDGNIITDYGQTIYDFKTRYLKPRITVNVKTAGTYDIYVKMFTPSGTLATGSSSPSGYSYKHSVTMTSGVHSYGLSGWGSNTAGHWKEGNYRFEFYYNGALIGKKRFSVK